MIRRKPRVSVDIVEHAVFIAEGSIDAGLRFPESVEATLEFLNENPLCGTPWSPGRKALARLRSWPVRGFPNHLIFYRPTRDGILVVRVLHRARELRAALEEDLSPEADQAE